MVGAEYILKQSKLISNPFWRDVYSAYSFFLGKLIPKNQKEAKCVYLFGNNNIKIGGKPIYKHKFIKKNIYTINDLLKNEGFLTFTEFTHKFGSITNFLEYGSIISATKAYLKRITIQDIGRRLEEPLLPLSLSILLKTKKGCRHIYDKMMHNNIKPTSAVKWSEMNGNVNNILKLFQLPYKCQKDTKLQWFQSRINYRILGTNNLLHKIKIKEINLCSLCHQQKETIIHLFCDCEIVKCFWNEIQTLINTYCPTTSLKLTNQDIIFGNRYFTDVLNTTIMLAKYHIFKSKENIRPNIEVFKKQLLTQYRIDQYNARENLKQEINEYYWSPFTNLINHIQ